MTSEMIEKFIDNNLGDDKPVRIHFKERASIAGIFVKGQDYKELKSKNFWRVIKPDFAHEWAKTRNMNLTRLYSGLSFTKLTENS
ncbi:MAG TPA: short-chain dehydrogenase [Puia sp.]|nr:short-chain dehydrogenase [Puia sp.]